MPYPPEVSDPYSGENEVTYHIIFTIGCGIALSRSFFFLVLMSITLERKGIGFAVGRTSTSLDIRLSILNNDSGFLFLSVLRGSIDGCF